MAKTNFQIFNEGNTPERTYNDSEYKEATQRLGGVMPGMALSRMHNKMYYQWSAMCKAIADFIVSHGDDCMDNDVAGISAAIGRAIAGSVGNAITTHNTAPDAHEKRFAALKAALDGYLPLTGGVLSNTLVFNNQGTQILGKINESDYYGIAGIRENENDGLLAICVADDGNEGIAVRQCGNNDGFHFGDFGKVVREARLLDKNGNTRFPGTVFAGNFHGNLQGNADTIGGKSLQWILDRINDTRTGIVAQSLGQNGYVKFANGFIAQWGHCRWGNVMFPISFSTTYSAVASTDHPEQKLAVCSVCNQNWEYTHVGYALDRMRVVQFGGTEDNFVFWQAMGF